MTTRNANANARATANANANTNTNAARVLGKAWAMAWVGVGSI
jgi:hypothetical protein